MLRRDAKYGYGREIYHAQAVRMKVITWRLRAFRRVCIFVVGYQCDSHIQRIFCKSVFCEQIGLHLSESDE
jgi:hypothetical protein